MMQSGYVYVSADDTSPMTLAEPGQIVRLPDRRPPWLVVCHELASVNIGRWPGTLWRVEVTDSIDPAEMEKEGAGLLRADAGYTRATAVRVLEELSCNFLLGNHGTKVSAVMTVASSLTLEQATRLAQARYGQAGCAQTHVWQKWLVQENGYSQRSDFNYVLEMSDVRSKSPIGHGLSILYLEACRRAEVVAGKTVWQKEPEDSDEVFLAEPWSGASAALLDAALAFGASGYADGKDLDILTKAWREVIGREPV